jgi:N-methylhydantoinase A
MGIGRILVPVHPSVLSALGMLMTDVVYTRVTTRVVAARGADGAAVEAWYRELEAPLVEALRAEGVDPDRILLERACDMRYHGQAYEVSVPLPGRRADGAVDVAALVARFHDGHRTVYGQADPREPVELVNFRVTGVGLVPKASLRPRPDAAGRAGAPVPKGERAAYFGAGAGWLRCPVFERHGLDPGAQVAGPALVEEPGATIVVYPGHRAAADAFGNLPVTVGV